MAERSLHGADALPDLVVFNHDASGPRRQPHIAFSDRTPIHPIRRLALATGTNNVAMRVVDLLAPVGKGQRGLIVAPPRTGKTVLLQQIASGLLNNHPECHVFVLLIDERPEEVTDMRAKVRGPQAEVVASTFDREPEEHRRAAETTLARAKRLVEDGRDVVVLLDSLTRLARACNCLAAAGGKLMTGGIVAGTLEWPKRFFGSARELEEGGSLTILATALIDTGSRMDEVIFEEFKGTGNMELVLDRRMADRRIWPAIEVARSGTRREELLLTREELHSVSMLRKVMSGCAPAETMGRLTDRLKRTSSNAAFLEGLLG